MHLLQLSLISWILVVHARHAHDEDSIFTFEDSAAKYFAWRFLPLLTAVLLGFFWGLVDADIRRLEPFYQMNKARGASMKDSLSLGYVQMLGLLVPFRALSRRHFGIASVSTVSIISTIGLPIVCDLLWDINYNETVVEVTVNTIFAYVILGGLGTMLVCTLLISRMLWARSYGLPRDPAGLAGIASLIYNSDILPLFQAIPAHQTQDYIDNELLHHRFKLVHDTTDGAFGTTISSVPDAIALSTAPRASSTSQQTFYQTRGEAHPWNLWMRFLILPEALLYIPSIGLIFASSDMKSGMVWSPKVVKALMLLNTTLRTMSWAGIEDALRLMEPFRQLATDKPSVSGIDAIFAKYEGLNPFARIV
jgi:hypothetical protein